MTSLRTIAAASFFALASFAVAPAAFAGDPVIDAAIEAGQVGETIDGLLGVVGEKQIAKLDPGEYYMDESGVWKRK